MVYRNCWEKKTDEKFAKSMLMCQRTCSFFDVVFIFLLSHFYQYVLKSLVFYLFFFKNKGIW